jgi:hypothetical protein
MCAEQSKERNQKNCAFNAKNKDQISVHFRFRRLTFGRTQFRRLGLTLMQILLVRAAPNDHASSLSLSLSLSLSNQDVNSKKFFEFLHSTSFTLLDSLLLISRPTSALSIFFDLFSVC